MCQQVTVLLIYVPLYYHFTGLCVPAYDCHAGRCAIIGLFYRFLCCRVAVLLVYLPSYLTVSPVMCQRIAVWLVYMPPYYRLAGLCVSIWPFGWSMCQHMTVWLVYIPFGWSMCQHMTVWLVYVTAYDRLAGLCVSMTVWLVYAAYDRLAGLCVSIWPFGWSMWQHMTVWLPVYVPVYDRLTGLCARNLGPLLYNILKVFTSMVNANRRENVGRTETTRKFSQCYNKLWPVKTLDLLATKIGRYLWRRDHSTSALTCL